MRRLVGEWCEHVSLSEQDEGEEELIPLLVHNHLATSVTVGLMGVLGTLLGGRRVSHSALRLRRTLDVALVTKARARVLMEE